MRVPRGAPRSRGAFREPLSWPLVSEVRTSPRGQLPGPPPWPRPPATETGHGDRLVGGDQAAETTQRTGGGAGRPGNRREAQPSPAKGAIPAAPGGAQRGCPGGTFWKPACRTWLPGGVPAPPTETHLGPSEAHPPGCWGQSSAGGWLARAPQDPPGPVPEGRGAQGRRGLPGRATERRGRRCGRSRGRTARGQGGPQCAPRNLLRARRTLLLPRRALQNLPLPHCALQNLLVARCAL